MARSGEGGITFNTFACVVTSRAIVLNSLAYALSAFEQDGSFGEGLLRMRKALADLLKRIDDAMAYEQLNERNK